MNEPLLLAPNVIGRISYNNVVEVNGRNKDQGQCLRAEEGCLVVAELKIPLVFYVDFAGDLPVELKLHGPSALVWSGKLDRKTYNITELGEMMSFYDDLSDSSACIWIRYVFPSIEVESLEAKFSFNALGNFSGVHMFPIKSEHMLGCMFTEVFSPEVSGQLGFVKKTSMITMGFEKQKWDIRVKWQFGLPLLGKE
ncbi:hypothetical protein AgCh_010954 [Apium graveolens]